MLDPSSFLRKPARPAGGQESILKNKLTPVARFFAAKGLGAERVAYAATAFSFLAGAVILYGSGRKWSLLLLTLSLLFLAGLNSIEEISAQGEDRKNKREIVVKELGNVLSEAFLYLPLCRFRGFPAFWIVLIVVFGIVSEMAGVIGIQFGASRRYDGPMGRGNRAIVFGLIGLVVGGGLRPGLWLGGIFIIVFILLIVTIVNRLTRAQKEII